MMIRLICIGKTQHPYVKEGMDEFIRRIGKYTRFEALTLPDVKNTRNMDAESRKKEESLLLLPHFTPQSFHILLDENGESPDSVKFARKLENILNRGYKNIHFYIGGPYGFSDEVRRQSDLMLSLSPMTFNHELVRLVFTEQLYRAYTIINNEPYHHG